MHPDFGAEMAVDASSARPMGSDRRAERAELRDDDLLVDRLGGPGVDAWNGITLLHGTAASGMS